MSRNRYRKRKRKSYEIIVDAGAEDDACGQGICEKIGEMNSIEEASTQIT